jgi:hypothetical protein
MKDSWMAAAAVEGEVSCLDCLQNTSGRSNQATFRWESRWGEDRGTYDWNSQIPAKNLLIIMLGILVSAWAFV